MTGTSQGPEGASRNSGMLSEAIILMLELPHVQTHELKQRGHGPPSSFVEQSQSGNATGLQGVEEQLAEMSLSKSQSGEAKREANKQYNDLLAEYNRLRVRVNAAEAAAATTSRQLRDHRVGLDQTKQQLTEESNTRLALAKDNHLLRSQISEMSIAQEPLRGEQYYVLEFTQLRMDIESWAAKETRNMTKQMLSDQEYSQILQLISSCGETGRNAAEWFQRIHRRTWQDRRIKIGLVRHFVAVVLFDHVFERFTFGFDRVWSKYFTDMEKLICRNGSTVPLCDKLITRKLSPCKNPPYSSSHRTIRRLSSGKLRCHVSSCSYQYPYSSFAISPCGNAASTDSSIRFQGG